MSSLAFTQYLAPANYIQIIQAIESLKVSDVPGNDLERSLKNAIESLKSESSKDHKKITDRPTRSGPVVRQFKPTKRLCIHFRNGKCSYGDNCLYLHKKCTNTKCKDEAQEDCHYGHDESVIKSSSRMERDDDDDEA